MYQVTRQDAADALGVSTRSVDRYIKSGKLRSEKRWKIIYIHQWDIDAIIGTTKSEPEVIIPQKKPKQSSTPPDPISQAPSVRESSGALEKIYADLRSEIQKKDSIIQTLSIQLGEAKEIAKNSVSLVEFKKSQFLLEESKWYLHKEVADIKDKKQELEEKLKYEKSTNYILIGFILVLFIILGLVWFLKI